MPPDAKAGCPVCKDGRLPCNPLHPECQHTKEMDLMFPSPSPVREFDPQVHGCVFCKDGRDPCLPQAGSLCGKTRFVQAQAAETPVFKGIPVLMAHPDPHTRRYNSRGLYLSPAEEEAVRLAEREALPMSALELAAIENCLAAERMGLATEEECVEALSVAGTVLAPSPAKSVWKPGSKMDRMGDCEDCGLNYCHSMSDPAPEPPPTNDMVNLPAHYARFKIEPIRFICENGLDFFQANIVKYVLRHDAKNGREDLMKAQRYLDMLIKFKDGDVDWWKAPL